MIQSIQRLVLQAASLALAVSLNTACRKSAKEAPQAQLPSKAEVDLASCEKDRDEARRHLADRDIRVRELSRYYVAPSRLESEYAKLVVDQPLRFEVEANFTWTSRWRHPDSARAKTENLKLEGGLSLEPASTPGVTHCARTSGLLLGSRSNAAFGVIFLRAHDPCLTPPQDVTKRPPKARLDVMLASMREDYREYEPVSLDVGQQMQITQWADKRGPREGTIIHAFASHEIVALVLGFDVGGEPGWGGKDHAVLPFVSDKAWSDYLHGETSYLIPMSQGVAVVRDRLPRKFDDNGLERIWEDLPGRLGTVFLPPEQVPRASSPVLLAAYFQTSDHGAYWLPFWKFRDLLAATTPDMSLRDLLKPHLRPEDTGLFGTKWRYLEGGANDSEKRRQLLNAFQYLIKGATAIDPSAAANAQSGAGATDASSARD